MPATPAHFDWIRRLLRAGASEGAFEPELATQAPESVLFFANLARALHAGTFPFDDGQGTTRTTRTHGFVYLLPPATPAGFVLLRALPADLNEIWLTAVDPAWRRRGMGAAMLRAVLSTPAGRSAHLARINTAGTHAGAIRHLLASVGYALERSGSEVDWYVHREAPRALAQFVRGPPAAPARR